MSRPDPRSVDFAALEVLDRVDRCGSFTRAAEELGVNQSAISYQVDKLRRLFGDPLFVREGRAQQATDRCRDILARTRAMTQDFLALAEPADFDPATAERRLSIACNYYERVLVIPPLARHLRRVAPGLRLEILNAADRGADLLMAGMADLLIGPFRAGESAFRARRLTTDRYCCLMDPSHPAAAQTPDLAGWLGLDHVVITYGGTWRSAYLDRLDAMGHGLRPTLSVPSPAGLGRLIAGTRLVATLPERLAREIAAETGAGQPPLALRPCPVPEPFDIRLVWTERNHGAPLHRWLRGAVGRVWAGVAQGA